MLPYFFPLYGETFILILDFKPNYKLKQATFNKIMIQLKHIIESDCMNLISLILLRLDFIHVTATHGETVTIFDLSSK